MASVAHNMHYAGMFQIGTAQVMEMFHFVHLPWMFILSPHVHILLTSIYLHLSPSPRM